MKNYSEKLKLITLKEKSGIYKLIINNGFYIGSSIDLKKRLSQHYNQLRAGNHVNKHLQNAFRKYNTIDFEIIELVSNVNQLISREQFYIDDIKPRYNIAIKAGSQLGFRHSEESKLLISTVQKGRKFSIETRQKMSNSRKGMKFTDKHRKKISISKIGEKNPFYKSGHKHPQFGIKKSVETRYLISRTLRLNGSKKAERNAASRTGVLYDLKTGRNYVFLSLKPLCENLGLPYKSICSSIYGKRFYADRFYTSYVVLPDGHTGTKNIPKYQQQ